MPHFMAQNDFATNGNDGTALLQHGGTGSEYLRFRLMHLGQKHFRQVFGRARGLLTIHGLTAFQTPVNDDFERTHLGEMKALRTVWQVYSRAGTAVVQNRIVGLQIVRKFSGPRTAPDGLCSMETDTCQQNISSALTTIIDMGWGVGLSLTYWMDKP